MGFVLIGPHNALRSHLPIESVADVALQGHYINYKYVSTPLNRNTRLSYGIADDFQVTAWEA